MRPLPSLIRLLKPDAMRKLKIVENLFSPGLVAGSFRHRAGIVANPKNSTYEP
jgi:hypothetical protein